MGLKFYFDTLWYYWDNDKSDDQNYLFLFILHLCFIILGNSTTQQLMTPQAQIMVLKNIPVCNMLL